MIVTELTFFFLLPIGFINFCLQCNNVVLFMKTTLFKHFNVLIKIKQLTYF